jgi:hypothetical protein
VCGQERRRKSTVHHSNVPQQVRLSPFNLADESRSSQPRHPDPGLV